MERYSVSNLASKSGCFPKICTDNDLKLGNGFTNQGYWRVFSTIGQLKNDANSILSRNIPSTERLMNSNNNRILYILCLFESCKTRPVVYRVVPRESNDRNL